MKEIKNFVIKSSYGFSSSHVQMWELNHKEGWALRNWCFRSVVLEKNLESPLDNKEIKPVNLKGNQPWILIGRTTAKVLILWLPDANSQLVRKDPAWCWERVKAGVGGTRRWDGWMASLTQWTWVWANSRRQWRTRKPRVLQSMGLRTRTWLGNWTPHYTHILQIKNHDHVSKKFCLLDSKAAEFWFSASQVNIHCTKLCGLWTKPTIRNRS